MRIITAHNILKVFFGICLCWKWHFLHFKPILSAILVTIATGKSKINARILHLGYSSNKPMMKLVKSNFQFLALKGAKIAP